MAASSPSHDPSKKPRVASRPQPRAGRDSQRSTKPLRPTLRSVLVIGSRATETAALALAFDGHEVEVIVAATQDEARTKLASRRWNWVMLDARWEEELLGLARAAADAVRCYVVDPKRVHGEHYQAIPLGQADVEAILG